MNVKVQEGEFSCVNIAINKKEIKLIRYLRSKGAPIEAPGRNQRTNNSN